jgi:hypothetical protein
MTQRADVGEISSPTTRFWRSLFTTGDREVAPRPTDPLHCDAPVLRNAEIAAVYTGQRVTGDFYEFLRVGPSRMLFVLLDIAGLRADTLEILIACRRRSEPLRPGFLPERTSRVHRDDRTLKADEPDDFAWRSSPLSGVHRLL